MKYFLLLIFIAFSFEIVCAQVNLAQISASLTSTGNTASISFTTQNSFINSGTSSNIKIFLRMPAGQTSSSTSVVISSAYPFVLVQNVVAGANRNMVFQANFPSGFDLATWDINQTYSIGDFTFSNFTGALSVELFSVSQSGSTWNGTSMTKLNTGGIVDNLVQWPVSQFAVLPITLKTFTAVKDGERSSRLDWTSSSEINSDYIGIERSDDGTEWTTLGQVKAAGNSNTDVEYQYIDRNIPLNRTNNQVYYYRLKLVDLDGRFKYSDIRGVNFDGAKLEALTLYPNPAAQFINVDISGLDTRDGDINLHIYDMAGKEVLTKSILGAGIEPVEIKHLTGGTYHVKVTQGDTQYHKKFIKID